MRHLPLVLAAALAVMGLSACSEEHTQTAAPEPPPPQVVVEVVRPADVPLSLEYAGRIAGVREVEVRARVIGILQKRFFVEGASVKAGDIMFQIDPAPFEVALAEAQAAVEQAQARVLQTQRDYERIEPLFERGNASVKARDDALAAFELAKGELAAAEAAMRSAEINLGYTKVEAPISGVTSLEAVSEGSLVGSSPESSLLTTITQVDPVYVNFAVPEAELSQIREQLAAGQLAMPAADGQLPVEIRQSNGAVHPQQGRINFLETGVNEQTGTVRVRAEVPNPENLLLPGQFVRIVVHGLTLPQALTVPAPSLMQGPQGPFLYVVGEDGRAEARPIMPGRMVGDRLVVVQGLQAGEQVITEGVIKARPGQPVQIAETPPAHNNAQATPAGEANP